MEKKDFTILYNGRKTECVSFGTTFLVQVTYKPVYLELCMEPDGTERWVDKETRQETPLARELGRLIRIQFLNN